VSRQWADIAVEAGALVIDNTSAFRLRDDVPLVVPEVNGEEVRNHRGIIANPNCSTIIMVLALKPIFDRAGIKRVVGFHLPSRVRCGGARPWTNCACRPRTTWPAGRWRRTYSPWRAHRGIIHRFQLDPAN